MRLGLPHPATWEERARQAVEHLGDVLAAIEDIRDDVRVIRNAVEAQRQDQSS